MTLPDPLAGSRTAALRAPGPVEPAPDSPRPRRRPRTVVRNVVRRAERRLLTETRQHQEVADRRLDDLERSVGEVRNVLVAHSLAVERAEITAVNLDLLKGEVRELQGALDRLGLAIAPAAGLPGAADRLAEIRERLNGLDRRLRNMLDNGSTSDAAPPPVAPERPASGLFDYVGFERRFRGDPQRVSDEMWARYGELLQAHPPVLDVGCGSGELVARLSAVGVAASGVDVDASMVGEARGRGLDVHRGDAVEYLAALPESSLGAVTAMQVAEHLPLGSLVRLLELAVSRLRPGGVFVAETPNPESLIVLGNSYILDPTHVWPIHPSLMVFLCESAGFRDVRLEFFAPAEGYHLPTVDAPDAPDWVATVNVAIDKLNRVLFGPQDYAVIATTPGPSTPE